jgi:hypothetical protein
MCEEEGRDPNFPAQRLGAHSASILIEQRERADLTEIRQGLRLSPTAERAGPEREQEPRPAPETELGRLEKPVHRRASIAARRGNRAVP